MLRFAAAMHVMKKAGRTLTFSHAVSQDRSELVIRRPSNANTASLKPSIPRRFAPYLEQLLSSPPSEDSIYGYEKDRRIERQDNWNEYARKTGKCCAYCGQVLTYEEYCDLARSARADLPISWQSAVTAWPRRRISKS